MQDPVSGVHVWITCWVARRGSVVCRPCVNEKNVLFCLQGISFMHFSSFFFLCMFQCCALYPSGVIHPYFLQPYLLLCNQLFSRPQTFLSKDSNVCSVVMDMLGIQQWAQSLAARVGVVYTGAVSCSSNADFFFFFFCWGVDKLPYHCTLLCWGVKVLYLPEYTGPKGWVIYWSKVLGFTGNVQFE